MPISPVYCSKVSLSPLLQMIVILYIARPGISTLLCTSTIAFQTYKLIQQA